MDSVMIWLWYVYQWAMPTLTIAALWRAYLFGQRTLQVTRAAALAESVQTVMNSPLTPAAASNNAVLANRVDALTVHVTELTAERDQARAAGADLLSRNNQLALQRETAIAQQRLVESSLQTAIRNNRQLADRNAELTAGLNLERDLDLYVDAAAGRFSRAQQAVLQLPADAISESARYALHTLCCTPPVIETLLDERGRISLVWETENARVSGQLSPEGRLYANITQITEALPDGSG